jgi:glycosyltransferase involved in cell wall biosynthesis
MGVESASIGGKPRILQINKFHFLNGGAELYYFGLSKLLRDRGHTVGHFSMKHPENVPCAEERFFVDNVDYDKPGGFYRKLLLAGHTVYSIEARKKLGLLLDCNSYDIAHLHNFHHQLTPSILVELKRRGLKIVHTVHDFKLVCPNYRMLTHDGVCERCKGHRYYQCVLHRCNRNSLSASAVCALEMYVQRLMGCLDFIDIFLAPANFTAAKIIEFGIPRSKVRVVPNMIDVKTYEPQYEPGKYLLYLGRLSPEKGVATLIRAMKRLPETPLVITGRGSYADEMQKMVRDASLRNIEFAGHLGGSTLTNMIRNCMAVVIPSEWYENCPFSVIEAFAYGKPVIGARIGGVGEMVADGETGYQFDAGDADGLADVLAKAVADPANLRAMGCRAREVAETVYDAEPHYDLIMRSYNELIRL